MRSKASFHGHAVHAALIPFPLAFLLGAAGFDTAGVLLGRETLWITGAHLAVAGIVAGLIAAVPGVIDYVYTVPPRSTGKKRARKHALVNVSALLLFALARWLRGSAGVEPEPLLLGVEGIGAVLLLMGGWMGGTLVSRNQIGVDHRYADAGKWSESSHSVTRGEPVVLDGPKLEVNQMRLLRIGDRRIVLGRTEDGYVAFDDRCPHRGGSLAGGAMICGTVQCPWHGSQFDVATGAVRAGPAAQPIRTYPVKSSGGRLEIDLESTA